MVILPKRQVKQLAGAPALRGQTHGGGAVGNFQDQVRIDCKYFRPGPEGLAPTLAAGSMEQKGKKYPGRDDSR
jgi:hypothetical protein